MNKILKLCIEKGFFLNKEVLGLLNELEENVAIGVVNILGGLEIKERIITKEVFDKYSDNFKDILGGGEIVRDYNIKLLSDFDFGSKKVEVADFVGYFRKRYESIKDILIKNNFNNLSSIRRIGINSGVYTIIAMVSEKRITKNKNLLIKVEDLTGSSIVLVNRENKDLFARAKNLLLDDVVAFRVSGSSKMLFVNDFVYPDAKLENEKFGNVDEYVAFSGDFHVGSKMFLEKNLLKFVRWLNGEIGNERQRVIAARVKYLFLTGDNIDGVGVTPEQEKFLKIKSCMAQYRKVEEILRKIRGDIQIVMCPGQHDAVWVGEPQNIISEKWAPGLYKMENLHLVPNPAMVEIGEGFNILMYHGASINHFINEIADIRIKVGHGSPTRVVKEILKRRHLAPIHGLVDYIPKGDKDYMVMDVVPDIIATADQHRAEVDSYNNILMVASSCWQSITPFEEKVGIVSNPCKVPLFNLKSRKIKIVDFSGEDEIKWECGEGLTCDIDGGGR